MDNIDIDSQIEIALRLLANKFERYENGQKGEFNSRFRKLKPTDEYYKELQQFDIRIMNEWNALKHKIDSCRTAVMTHKANRRQHSMWLRSSGFTLWRSCHVYNECTYFQTKPNPNDMRIIYYFANAGEAVLFKLARYDQG